MKRGFTLIELLVVVAIIGILASVITASVNHKKADSTEYNAQSTDAGITFPEPTNYAVVTNASVDAVDVEYLNRLLKEKADAGHEIGVLITDTTQGLSIEEYGIRLAEKWKVGDKHTDNGAIIIIATQDRKARIEVGSGLEATLTDAEAKKILMETMVPYLKDGQWFKASVAGVEAISAN